MNTIKIYLTESGRIADLQKDFPLYQGQFQNKLLNVFVPTSILAPIFTSSGAVSADYVASTSTKIGMTYTARDGSIKTSKNYYMRYLKTLMYKGVEYALYERKLPKEFTFYAGQGENSPVLIINVVNIEQQSGDTPPLVLSVITSQTCHLDVMQSTFLDRDELDEPSELENLNAQVQALNALMPKKQDKEDENIALEQAPAEKTVVGAINELGGLVKTAQSSADTAQQTAETAQTTADNATTLANNAVATANNAVATANEAKTTAQTAETNANSAVDTANAANTTAGEAKAIAQGSQRAIGFATLQAAITALNGYNNTQLKVGDNVYIVETGVPDLWVAAVEQNSVAYNYTTNDAFNDDLVENTLVQVGYYKFAYLESDGKPCTVAWQNMTVAESDWVASTEFADFAYEAKIILSDFVNFSSIPQVVFGLTEATSGNYAPICKAGDKGVYIYSKVNTAITLPTVVTFAPNVHGASMQGGGYTNKGKWVASTTYAIDDLVYTDNGQYVCIEGITSTTSPEQDTTHWQATFVATGKTKNGLKFSGQDNGTGVQKTFDGSTAVEVAFDETTMTAKEVNGVLKVGAKGTVPEALPQEASALKSGSLPTSGWNTTNPNLITSNIELHIKKEETQLSSLNKKIDSSYFNYTGNWQVKKNGTGTSTSTASYISTINGKQYRTIEFPNPDLTSEKYTLFIDESGNLYRGGGSSYWTTPELYALNAMYAYAITDTSITANSDVLMELTDEGGVKAYSMEAGKMTVIRDTVPTQAIPYTYKVKQTNASGQFTVINHYVPKVEIPTIPTKTSELINDSGYVSNLPIVRNVVCNDVDSAATLDTTITCEVGDLILAQIIVRSALTLPTEWTLLRTIPAVETSTNQTLSFAYKKATSTSETLTVTQASAGRIYTNLVRLSNATSISYIQSCEKTGTGIKSILSTKPVTPNMVIWGAASATWNTSSPYGDWTYSPSTLDYYSLPQATKAPRLGTFIDSSGAGERTFTGTADSSTVIMCGAVEIVGDEVARKGDIPTSLPVTYKKASGTLPTSGWTEVTTPNLIWEGTQRISAQGTKDIYNSSLSFVPTSEMKADTEPTHWQYKKSDGTWADVQRIYTTDGTYNGLFLIITPAGGYFTGYEFLDGFDFMRIANGYTAPDNFYGIRYVGFTQRTYTISDTDITANTSVKMYLTDEGGVKAYSKANGSIQVIRDSVPTTAIPYEYEVEQTSAEGLFEVINAYVPTKTSELTNDSGFITAADIGNALYPVGSIYMSVNNTNPSTFFGGTWEAWGAGKVPVGVDTADTDFNAVEKTGGEKTHILTVNEMPKHSHSLPTFYSNPEKENITFADSAFNADKASDGNVSNGGQVISTGGGQAHNNLQPYITCYMWKRTA